MRRDDESRTILGGAVPNLPWEDQAGGDAAKWCGAIAGTPIIGGNPVGRVARVFNSAAIPYEGGFVACFRADHRNARARPALRPERRRDSFGNWSRK